MIKTSQYFTRGLWIFALMIAGMLVLIYSIQAENTALLFVSIICCFILALGLMRMLMQANKALGKSQERIFNLEKRLNTMMQTEQKTDMDMQNQEIFNVNNALARIMHPVGKKFDSVSACIDQALRSIGREMEIVQGLVFMLNEDDQLFHITGEYAYFSEEKPKSFPLGETLSGQVAKNQKILNISDLPDGYVTVLSGLGKSNPRHLIIAPMIRGAGCIGVMELASFKPFGKNEELLVQRVCETMTELLNELSN